ncbi:MAG: IS66 family transposase [Actinomycetota bacterium]|nr:IS66 family transposase [Actinomycetota bacterium]
MTSAPPRPATLPEAHAVIEALWAEHARLREVAARLETQLQELEARLGQNSANSSQPPSADPPQAPPRPPQPSAGRRRGAQPGHPAHRRSLLPPEEVDASLDHWPAVCQHCQTPLAPDPAQAVGEPIRHQVVEVPPLRAEVSDHYLHRLRCPRCGGETRAGLPPAVPPGAFGPRLQAVIALLSSRYRLSRREVAAVCADLLGVDIAVGSVDALCQVTAQALAAPVAALQAAVQQAEVVNADETQWRLAGQRCWLWVAVSAVATVFTVATSRGSTVIKGLLGEPFAGVLGSDRWSAYSWVAPQHRQVCWAHLKRDFQALVDRGGAARPIGEAALALLARLFDAWHHARDDPAARARLPVTLAPLQAEFRTLLEEGTASESTKAAGLCRALLKLWPALWTFVTAPGVEPTNNVAERAIRPAVLWRKGSFGSQSAAGAEFVARMLSVTATCRQQGRPLLAYLTAVCTAAQCGHPIPPLLPELPHAPAV